MQAVNMTNGFATVAYAVPSICVWLRKLVKSHELIVIMLAHQVLVRCFRRQA